MKKRTSGGSEKIMNLPTLVANALRPSQPNSGLISGMLSVIGEWGWLISILLFGVWARRYAQSRKQARTPSVLAAFNSITPQLKILLIRG